MTGDVDELALAWHVRIEVPSRSRVGGRRVGSVDHDRAEPEPWNPQPRDRVTVVAREPETA